MERCEPITPEDFELLDGKPLPFGTYEPWLKSVNEYICYCATNGERLDEDTGLARARQKGAAKARPACQSALPSRD